MIRKKGGWRVLARAVARACAGAGVHAVLVAPALAQPPPEPTPPPRGRNAIEEIVVEDRADAAGYRTDGATLTKLTEPLRDVPQSIITVPRELLEDRGATSLNDALRTVPGITLGAGEFSWQGNNPNMRGFSSRNDMFLDGMRDFGSYPRDPFNLESIEVLQGPSSMIFGRGSTGGVINQASKRPTLEPFTSVSFNGGNDETVRATADIARSLPGLGSGAALRVNAMAHQGEVAGRDVAQTERYGIAPSLALGLGGPTQVTLSYLHQSTDDVPDYGLPWFNGAPAAVPRHNFYGFETDYLKTDADILSADVVHSTTSTLQLRGMIRTARYERRSRLSEPLIAGTVPPSAPLDTISVMRNVFTGRSVEAMTQAQGDATLHFATGGVEHALVTGFELGRESSGPLFGFALGVPNTNLVNPTPNEPFTSTGTVSRLDADTDADSAGVYALDTIKLGDAWQVIAGVRWDRFDVDYRAERFTAAGVKTGDESIRRVDDEWSYRFGLVYKPREAGSVYLGWGTSFNPSAETLSFITTARAFGINNAFLAPEENNSVEIGTKWDLLEDKLSVNAAVFRITKDNARVPDPNNAGFNMLAGEQRVDGYSLTLMGTMGERWQITSGYTHLDSEQTRSAAGAAPAGSPLPNAPEDTFTSWATYAVSKRFEVGAGARYVSEQLAQNVPPIKSVESYWALDAMGKYQLSERFTLKLNLTNVTDEYYFDQLHGFHVVPGAGLTAVFAVNAEF
jgi:catecholate siderophore receptor